MLLALGPLQFDITHRALVVGAVHLTGDGDEPLLEIAAQMAAERADVIEISLASPGADLEGAQRVAGQLEHLGLPVLFREGCATSPTGARHLVIGDQFQPVGLDHAGVVMPHAADDDDEIGVFIGELTAAITGGARVVLTTQVRAARRVVDVLARLLSERSTREVAS